MIPLARADATAVPCVVLFLRPGGAQEALEATVRFLQDGCGFPLEAVRLGAQRRWQPPQALDAQWVRSAVAAGNAGLEARSALRDDGVFHASFATREAVLGEPRASSLLLRFPAFVPPRQLVAVARWACDALPLWWGTVGPVFVAEGARPDLSAERAAALAKRYWAVQVLDLTAMQWDAPYGLHSIGWLTLVSHALLREREVDTAGGVPTRGVYRHDGRCAAVFAAGDVPILGDINRHEELGPYRAVNGLLDALLLRESLPWSGPFGDAELRQCWIRRFADPQAWLAAEIPEAT